eukprot:COSAG01_NODE_60411_length_295_cov_0.551020_1_plen_36_part_10
MKFTHRCFISAGIALLFLSASADERPNVLFIIADDA